MTRQEFLKKSVLGCAGVAVAVTVPACSLFDANEMLVGKLADIEKESFFITKFNGKKICVFREEEGWVIFSLVCTHKKCTVDYVEAQEQFVCPCHDGLYDKQGQVVDGPPPRPLDKWKAEVRGDELWVLKEAV